MNVEECRDTIIKYLKQFVKKDYVFLDLPYYTNVGDILIWQSTLDVLKHIPYKCLYSSSIDTYYPPKISDDTPILFMGGGNFGDLWENHQIFRKRVLDDYPNNPIIQLPQSVCFLDSHKLHCDVDYMGKHRGHIVLMLRDQKSYDIIAKNYKNVEYLLVPDMVLSFDVKRYCSKHSIKLHEGEGELLVRRKDSEKIEDEELMSKLPPRKLSEGDWPTMESDLKLLKYYKYTIRVFELLHFDLKIINRFKDFVYAKVLKDLYLSSGIRFIDKYRIVYSTRLHVSILAYLMQKEVYIIDNSYGKCLGVYNKWMSDQKNVKPL